MLRLVCKAFNGDELCAAEAGTGVGKSLAYLLPAIAWAIRNKERVVVSTNTINLQQQLLDKDIPLVKRILGEDPKVVLVKGRRNYLCLHRLNEALDEMSLFEERDSEILAIKEWSRTTETGSRTDLSFYPEGGKLVPRMLGGGRLPGTAMRTSGGMLCPESAPGGGLGAGPGGQPPPPVLGPRLPPCGIQLR